jgi:hypothetical protein
MANKKIQKFGLAFLYPYLFGNFDFGFYFFLYFAVTVAFR